MLRYAILLALMPVPALADEPTPTPPAPAPDKNACTGKVSIIETSQDGTPGAWLWLDGQHCKHGTPDTQPVQFSLMQAGSKHVWKEGWRVATAAYARRGTVTVIYDWTDGITNKSVPIVTRINAPCMALPKGGC